MINNIDELKAELKSKTLLEHRHGNVELKSDWDIKYGQRISGLANKTNQEVGWLVVGVSDDGALCGKNEGWAKKTEEIISQQLNNCLNPVQSCGIDNVLEISGSWIIVLKINPPGALTYWDGTPYKAAGTTFSPMKPEEIMQTTLLLPGLEDYSAREWHGEYDTALVLKFAELICARDKYAELKNLNTLSPDEILRRTGISNRNVVKILFGDCNYRVVFYNSDNEPITNNTYKGLFGLLLDPFIDSIQTWTKKEMHSVRKGLSVAYEDPYPIKALREAFANAIAHAAYFENSGEIIVEVYTDKLVISNLCLPGSIYFANKWFSTSHHTVNRILMETLRLAGFVDELGRGKNVIFSEMLNSGKKPPMVNIENAGQYSRWRLVVYDGLKDALQLKLLERIKSMYKDIPKALLANALVLWRDLPVSDIRKFIDGESVPLLKEILSDLRGPIFYYEKADRITLRRWANILLTEGKDSKTLSAAEEEDLRRFAYDIQTKYHNSFITNKELRELAAMGHTQSESVLCSKLLKKWEKEGFLQPVRRGVYQFVRPVASSDLGKLLQQLVSGTETS